jgi:hypothetical protein
VSRPRPPAVIELGAVGRRTGEKARRFPSTPRASAMEMDRPSSSQIWTIRRCSTWSPPRNRAPKPLSGPIPPVQRHRPAVLVDASPGPPPYHSWREYKGIAADCADFGRAGTEHHALKSGRCCRPIESSLNTPQSLTTAPVHPRDSNRSFRQRGQIGSQVADIRDRRGGISSGHGERGKAG